MAERIMAATERALARVAAGETAYRAALTEGIALSTIYRALARRRALPKAKTKTETKKPGAGRAGSRGGK